MGNRGDCKSLYKCSNCSFVNRTIFELMWVSWESSDATWKAWPSFPNFFLWLSDFPWIFQLFFLFLFCAPWFLQWSQYGFFFWSPSRLGCWETRAELYGSVLIVGSRLLSITFHLDSSRLTSEKTSWMDESGFQLRILPRTSSKLRFNPARKT